MPKLLRSVIVFLLVPCLLMGSSAASARGPAEGDPRAPGQSFLFVTEVLAPQGLTPAFLEAMLVSVSKLRAHQNQRLAGAAPVARPGPLYHAFDAYLQRHGLSDYTALRPYFTPSVMKALLEDPALRPVFLQALPRDDMGRLVVIDQELVRGLRFEGEPLVGLDLLKKMSGFSAGSAIIANGLAEQGSRILVGVTDVASRDRLEPRSLPVANGRCAYFPLADGTWLGLKGSGQFQSSIKPPHYLDTLYSKHQGLSTLRDARRATRTRRILKDREALFVQFLGYRRLKKLPDGEGNLLPTDGLAETNGEPLEPVLMFIRALSPHRVDKFPQLLKTDPGLSRLTRQFAVALKAVGRLSLDCVLTPDQFMVMTMGWWGRAEAVKQNHGLFKRTIHSQDFVFPQEADGDEGLTRKEYLQSLAQGYNEGSENMELFRDQRLAVAGMAEKFKMLIRMRYPTHSDLLPDYSALLKALFVSYFQVLDTSFLKLWVVSSGYWIYSRPILSVCLGYRLEIFHRGNEDQQRRLEQRNPVMRRITGWAQREINARARRAA